MYSVDNNRKNQKNIYFPAALVFCSKGHIKKLYKIITVLTLLYGNVCGTPNTIPLGVTLVIKIGKLKYFSVFPFR